MKIKELTVYGYGKWVDKTITISSDFHVLYGENEAGKTTLMSFIHSILFGFPTRHSSSLRYEPKDSSRYGGKILLEDNEYKEVTIERLDGKATGNVQVFYEDGTVGSDQDLNKMLHGINRELYQNLFSFRLNDLEEVEKLTEGQLHRYFLSAGALGSEEFLKEADHFSNEASKLYKPKGRVPKINQKLKQLEEKQRTLNEAKKNNINYLEMVQQIEQLKEKLERLDKEQATINRELELIQEQEKDWHITKDVRSIAEEIKNITLPELPENGLFQMNHLNSEIENIRQVIRENQEKLKDFREEHRPSKLFLVYEERKPEIDRLKEKLPVAKDYLREKQYAKKILSQSKQAVKKEKIKEGLPLDSDVSIEWSEEKEQLIENWQKQASQVRTQIQETEQQLANTAYKISSHTDMIDEIESDLWSNNQFKQESKIHDNTQNKKNLSTNSSKQYKEIAGIVVGLILFLSSFVFEAMTSWIMAGMGIVVFSLCTFIIRKKKADQSSLKNKEQDDYQAYIQQKEKRKQWRNQLAIIDALEETKQQKQKEKVELENKFQHIRTQWKQLKKAIGLEHAVDLEDALKTIQGYLDVEKKEKEMEKIEQKIVNLNEKLKPISQELDFLYNLFPVNDDIEQKLDMFQYFLKQVHSEEKELEQYVKDSQEVERNLNQLVGKEKDFLHQKQQLFKAAETDSEDVFRYYYDQLKGKNQKEEKLKVLKEQYNTQESSQNYDSLADLQNEKQQLLNKKKQFIKTEKEVATQKIELELKTKKLEKGGEYTALLQDFENEKSELQSFVDEWTSNKIATFLIEQTLKYSMKDRLPKTIKEAESYFAFLTEEKYTEIVIDHDKVQVRREDGQYYGANELSRGTSEPLYVALRLAFVKNMQDVLRIPIIVDDGFVNFDRRRRKKVYQLLKQFSREVQVLYFTFDEDILEETNENHVTVLS